MSEEQIDNRPVVEPDCFSFDPEGGVGWFEAAQKRITELWRGEVEWARWTIVSDEYPKPPYDHGLYFEGWTVSPYRMNPPHREAPFNYPLTTDASS